jgi:predicted O-methyltransferase YrrM
MASKFRKRLNRILRKYFKRPRAHRRILSQNLLALLERTPSPIVLETGCIRLLNEGTESTLTIASTLKGAGRFLTFELRPDHIENCRQVCREWNEHITYVQGDSILNLRQKVRSGELERVDFAFLDSSNDGDHTFREFQEIEACFVPGSVLVVDDVLWADKGRVLVPYIQGSDQWQSRIYNEEKGFMVAQRL